MPLTVFTQYDQYDIDFLILLNILALFLLAALCFSSEKKHRRILSLYFLGAAALSGSIAWGIDLWIYTLPTPSSPLLLHDIFFSLPHFFLIEFWIRSRILAGQPGYRVPVYSGIAVFSVIFLLCYFMAGMHLFRVASPFFGYLFLTWTFWSLSRPLKGSDRKQMLLLFFSSAFIFSVALPLLYNRLMDIFSKIPVAQATVSFYHNLFSTEIFSLSILLLLHSVAFFIFSLAIWFFYLSFLSPNQRKRINRTLWVLLLLFFVLFIGFANIEKAEDSIEKSIYEALIETTVLLAASINTDYIHALSGTEGDRERHSYQSIRMTLNQLVKSNNAIRNISIAGLRSKEVIHLVDCRGNQEMPVGTRVDFQRDTVLASTFMTNTPGIQKRPVLYNGELVIRATAPILYDDNIVTAALAVEFSRPDWLETIDTIRNIPLQNTLVIAIGVIILFISIYKQQRLNIIRVSSIQKYQTLFESVSEGLMYVRVIFSKENIPVDIICLEMNHSAEKLLNISPVNTINKSIRDIFYKNDTERAMYWIVYFGEVALTQRSRAADIQFTHNKKTFEVQAISWQKGYGVLLFTDITERREMEKQHRRLALYDPLTELPNRRLLTDRLEQAMERTNRSKISCAVLYMDLDKFKPVNDAYGHNFGDIVLQDVAQRLRGCIRKSDTLARIGGDEFIIVQQEVQRIDQIHAIAEKIQKAFASPFVVDGVTVQPGISIGVSLYPDHATGITQLMAMADMAMYKAKQDTTVPFVLADKNEIDSSSD